MTENDKNREPYSPEEVIADFEDSKLQGGLVLDEIKDGEAFEIKTKSGSTYKLESKNGVLCISGGSRNIPEGTPAQINGAVGIGSTLAPGVILRGKKIEMMHPTRQDSILTTDFVTEITPISFKKPGQ
jgi:hypothetical protein